MIKRDEALEYHAAERAGKLEIRPTKPSLTAREMRLAYLPGAAFPAAEIAADPEAAFRYTTRANLVGVLTNGSAVPGLGEIGPLAAKPMLEGIAVLMKRLADIDAFDLEIATGDPDRFVELATLMEPTFGAIVVKDIRAPEGLDIFDRLCGAVKIPVFHENLQSTAVVAGAALMNAFALAGKDPSAARVVICGAGTVGIGCARMLVLLGIRAGNLLLYDVHGPVEASRGDLNVHQRVFARDGLPPTLDAALDGADVFIGASAGGVLTPQMINRMAPYPIVFALATPQPEITYDAARATRRDIIVATALTQSPNAVVDLLSFPFVLRGALDAHATRITDGMLLAAVRSLADLAREEVVDEVSRAYGGGRFSFGPEYLLPKPIDPRILVRESTAVAKQAIADGVARVPVNAPDYQEGLIARIGTGREVMRSIILKARRERMRIAFPEGSSETVLRACSILADEGVARPVLLGDEQEIRAAIDRLAVDLAGAAIVDPRRSPRAEAYSDEYFRLRRRRGVMRIHADERMQRTDYFGAMMLHAGDADLLLLGLSAHYPDSLRVILEIVGTARGVRRVSSAYMVVLPKEVYFFADCAVNIDPDADTLAEIALLTAGLARSLAIEPRIAMLSFSNFGSVDHPMTTKVRRATEIVKREAPDLAVDGEMQLATALNRDIRTTYFPFSELTRDANVLVFPDLQAANMAMQLLQRTGDALLVGPILLGTRLPAHLIQYGSSVEALVDLAATGVVTAAPRRAAASPQALQLK